MGNCQNNNQSTDSAHGKQQTEKDSIPKHNVLIKTATWGRDSHGLFDYEAHDLTNSEFRLKGPSQVYRKANVVAMKGDGEVVSSEEDSDLLRISNTDDFLYVHANQSLLSTFRNNGPTSGSPANKANNDVESNDKAVWLVIKALKKLQGYSKGYPLKEGDIVKLGRVRFRVKELCADSSKPSTNKPQVDDKSVFLVRKPSIGKDYDGSKNVPICRICLCECGEEDNPLVNPCRCDGTMKYVHILCLQTWLKSRLQTKTTPIAFTVAWKTLDCELCHKPFPSILEVEGVRYYPLEMPRSEAKSYVILEVLSKDTPQVRGLHLINMTLKPVIKLGRGHESDLRIADISVSRNHATITFDQDGFYLNDNDSKFGSLVQARKAFPLISELSGTMVQIGRTVCTFDIPSKQTTFPLSLLGSTTAQKPIAFEFNREQQEFEEYNELNNNIFESLKDVQSQKDGRKTTSEERPRNNGVNEVVQSPGHRNPQIIEEPANIEELLYENNPVQGGA